LLPLQSTLLLVLATNWQQLEFDSLLWWTLSPTQWTLSPIRTTLLPGCMGPKRHGRPRSTFNKVDRVKFNFAAGVYRPLKYICRNRLRFTVAMLAWTVHWFQWFFHSYNEKLQQKAERGDKEVAMIRVVIAQINTDNTAVIPSLLSSAACDVTDLQIYSIGLHIFQENRLICDENTVSSLHQYFCR